MFGVPREILDGILEYVDLASTVMLSVCCKDAICLSPKARLKEVYDSAADNGCINQLDWLYGSNKLDKKTVDCKQAARNGYMHVIKWVDARYAIYCWVRLYRGIIIHGNLDMMKKLYDHHPVYNTHLNWDNDLDEVAVIAAKYGRVSMLDWLNTKGTINKGSVLFEAIKYSQLDVVKWVDTFIPTRLRGHNQPCYNAARTGNLEILQWLVSAGYSTGSMLSAAADRGHLHILKWAKSVGMSLNIGLYINAADSGHIHVLDWLFAEGVPVHHVILINACRTDETRAWLAAHT